MKRYRQLRSSNSDYGLLSRLWVYLLLLVIGVGLTAGCTKQRANLSLNKAKKLLSEAVRHEAPRLEPQSYEDTKKQIEEAERLVAEKRFKQALERASRAVDKAKDTVEKSKSKLAAQRINEAKEALDVAEKNSGAQEDLERYNKIKNLYKKAREKLRKNKWDEVIRLCEQEMGEVDTLLAPLLNQAKRKQVRAQNKFNEMKTAGAPDYAPEYVVRIQDMLRTIEKNITVDRDYQGARNLADETIRTCEEGITATKGKMAQEQISKIESGLSEAVNKGAQIYANDLLERCNETFDTIIKQYYEKKYDKVLDSAKILGPMVERLIHTTRLKSAEAKIHTVEKEIDSLVEGGARQYLPGRVEKVEEYLKLAKENFNQEKFEEAEDECMIALREGEKTRAAFNDLALDAMRNAAESLDISRNVFDKMSEIFIMRTVETLSDLDRKFEQNKTIMKTELDGILKNARLTLGIAKLRQEEGKYRKAIELAGEVKRSTEYVLNETYHVVAHNAIMELADQITRRETDGAREYAPIELDRTRILLEQAKKLLAGGEYKKAVSKASETRAQLELTIQEIAQKAVENINAARRQIAKAPAYKTSEFQKSELEKARILLKQAEDALQAQRLKPAVETALKAASVASEASREAARLWAQQTLKKADEAIARAENAGANAYAAEQLDEAKRFYASAQNLFKSENSLEGKDVALRAIRKANNAFYKNVITAETAINEAKSYDGWKYKYKTLSQAIVDSKLARESIERGDYFSSSAYAEKATLEARKVVRESKKEAFKNRVANISSTMDGAMHSGVNYFQVKDAKKVYHKLADLEEQFTLSKYDYVSFELDKLEADLHRLVTSTPDALKEILSEQRKRLAHQRQTDAVDFAPDLMESAERYLRYAKIDFDKKRFSQSYRNLRSAVNDLNEIDRRLALQAYSQDATRILEDLSDAMDKFRPVLDLGPQVLERFSQGPNGKGQFISIACKMKPGKFRNIVSELYQKARLIKAPESVQATHKDLIDMLNDAQMSAIYFERLIILDEYKPQARREIIKKAYAFIQKVKERRSDIQKALLRQEERFHLAKGLTLTAR